jgi:hypothetical protein
MIPVEAGFLDFLKRPPQRPRAGENALSMALSPSILDRFIGNSDLGYYVRTNLDTWAIPNGVQAEFSLASDRTDMNRYIIKNFQPLLRALEGYAGVPVKMDVETTFNKANNWMDLYPMKYTVTFTAKTPAGSMVNASARRVASRYLATRY